MTAVGQNQSARMALEQLHAELFFQRGDLAGDGRLGDAQTLAGERQASGVRRRMKRPQLSPIHGKPRASSANGTNLCISAFLI
jgi:hypothetical protein